jgi:hypothetical protein
MHFQLVAEKHFATSYLLCDFNSAIYTLLSDEIDLRIVLS